MTAKAPLVSHLEELRARLIIVIVVFFSAFLLAFAFSNKIIHFITHYVSSGAGLEVIAVSPLDFFMAKLSTALFSSLIFAFPLLLIETLLFVKPALYKREKGLLLFFCLASALFFAGAVIGCFFISKIGVKYFSSLASAQEILNLWSVNKLMSFVFISSILSGFILELPVLMLLLSHFNIINTAIISSKRKELYVLILVLSAMLTPPDPLTMILLATPLIIVFEISLIIPKLVGL